MKQTRQKRSGDRMKPALCLHFFTALRPFFDRWWPSAASPSCDECDTNCCCLQIRQRRNGALLQVSFAQVTNIWPLTVLGDIGSIHRIEEWFRSSPYPPLPRQDRPNEPLPDNPISLDNHPTHNMHETCQSSCLTMPAHNELHGCSGACQSRNGASVRLSAIIHSFWKQSLSIQVSLGLQNEPDTCTHKASNVSDMVWYQSYVQKVLAHQRSGVGGR